MTEGAVPAPAVSLEPLACFRSYADLLSVLRSERERSGMKFMDIDHMSGLHDGYSAKILSPSQERRLGVLSLPILLEVLGLALVVCRVPPRAQIPPIAKQAFVAKET